MMRGKLEPFEMPIVVHATKHIVEIPQMTFPHERQLKEQRHEVKKEHDTRFQEGEEHLHFDGDLYEDWMEIITNPQHFQHL